MAMIVEALALAEGLDGGRWFNWVDLPAKLKRYLATFPSRAQYERVLAGQGSEVSCCPEVRALCTRAGRVFVANMIRVRCVHGWDDGPLVCPAHSRWEARAPS